MEVKKPVNPLPRVVDYDDYRAFLRDHFEHKRSLRAGFSYRRFSSLCGLKSPNYLQLVIQGKRNLTLETAERIAKALKLSLHERRYFAALVRRESVAGAEEEKEAERAVFKSIKGLRARFIERDEFEFFDQWYYVAVRELALLKDFEASPEFVRSRLANLVSIEQAESALKFLIDRGLLVMEKGRYVPKDPVLDSGNEIFRHEKMQDFHSRILGLWSRHLPQLGHRHQELGLLNIPVPAEKIPELRERIRQFQDELIGWVESFEGNDTLVQLGTYLMVFEKKD